MATLMHLANRMDKLAQHFAPAANDTAKQAAVALVTDLVHITPVDTSRALSNWQVTLGSPANNSLLPYFRGDAGSTQAQSAEAAIEAAKAVIAAKKPGQPLYITNNLRYIQRLNDGWSAQAPAGFVERAVLIARRLTQRIRIVSGLS